MVNFDVGVILPAAGTGDRLGGPTPKQYCKIMGRPLFLYALQEFLAVPWVKKIALVVDNPDHACRFLEETCFDKDKLIVVQGEHTRHRSIRAGVQEILKNDLNLQVLVVHDAVRPFVPMGFLEELVLSANEHGAAGAIRPLVSTVVKQDENGFLQKCLDRSEYVASETPQAFQSNVLSKAFSHCSEEELEKGTECLQLALAYAGVSARLITGPSDLWKVTYKKDLYAATCCIRGRLCGRLSFVYK
ncbi:Isoprenoid synthase domain-containing protein [Gryllus bimaculatus]|nr:Isoprenoid synthase domain-containing protein [Gryllus bimaculatus]